MKVSFISEAALKGVRQVSIVSPDRDGATAAVRQVFVRQDRDPQDVLKVSIVRPGWGVIKQLRIELFTSARRQQSGFLRPIEKGVRKLARREAQIAAAYLDRHETSNRRKSNGWVKDLPRNISRSIRSD